MNVTGGRRKSSFLPILYFLVVLGLFIGLAAHGQRSKAEELPAFEYDSSKEVSLPSASNSQESGSESDQVTVVVQNAVTEDDDSSRGLAAGKATSTRFTPTYDVTSSDNYLSVLYDVFLNQGNTYDDFIIYRSGDYQYVLVYGSIKSDLSFSSVDVVTLNITSNWQSGKRYSLSYASDQSGSFNSSGYTFLSNLKSDNALTFHNYFERKELYKVRIALYILAVLTIVTKFNFFKGGLRSA